METGAGQSESVPELLFHTILTVIHHNNESGNGHLDTYVLGTRTTLEAAKSFAKHSLTYFGYAKEEFEIYEERTPGVEWKHGDGVMVYGKTAAQQEVLVTIDTKPNAGRVLAAPDGTLLLPGGTDHLHYVLQSVANYNTSRVELIEIEGAYAKRVDALAAAKRCLIDGNIRREDYAQYDERDDLSMPQDWPFGEDVIVHAVSANGENYLVSLKIPPFAYERHHKRKLESHRHRHRDAGKQTVSI